MRVSIVVAVSTNHVIGKDGQLPWRLPEDLRRFKALTTGKAIVMGRLTHESIGRPLPNRRNIVLSSRTDYRPAGCEVVNSVQAVMHLLDDLEEVMVIGGGNVYRDFLPIAERLYVTRVHASFEGDAYFPQISAAEWRVVSAEEFPISAEREHAFRFEVLERR
jgi:dihydrofolate reductase